MPGSTQKRRRLEARDAREVGYSQLAFVILTAIGRGPISPLFGQTLAPAGVVDVTGTLDGYDVPGELNSTASIGTHGKHAQKCRNDCFSRVASVSRLVVFVAVLPFKPSRHSSG